MKNKILFILFLGILSSNIQAQQVQMRFVIPQRNRMPSSIDEWLTNPVVMQVIVQNITNNQLDNIQFSYTLKGSRLGGVSSTDDASPLSRKFSLAPNETRNFLLEDLVHPKAIVFTDEVAEKIIRDGIPEDEYDFCARILDANGIEIGTSIGGCQSIRVVVPDPPTLVAPIENDIYDGKRLLRFAWTSVPGANVSYKLIVKPLLRGQAPAAAIQSNPIIFENELVTTSYTYQPSDPLLDYAGAIGYVWQVSTFSDDVPYGRNKGKSLIGQFAVFNSNDPTSYSSTAFFPFEDGYAYFIPKMGKNEGEMLIGATNLNITESGKNTTPAPMIVYVAAGITSKKVKIHRIEAQKIKPTAQFRQKMPTEGSYTVIVIPPLSIEGNAIKLESNYHVFDYDADAERHFSSNRVAEKKLKNLSESPVSETEKQEITAQLNKANSKTKATSGVFAIIAFKEKKAKRKKQTKIN